MVRLQPPLPRVAGCSRLLLLLRSSCAAFLAPSLPLVRGRLSAPRRGPATLDRRRARRCFEPHGRIRAQCRAGAWFGPVLPPRSGGESQGAVAHSPPPSLQPPPSPPPHPPNTPTGAQRSEEQGGQGLGCPEQQQGQEEGASARARKLGGPFPIGAETGEGGLSLSLPSEGGGGAWRRRRRGHTRPCLPSSPLDASPPFSSPLLAPQNSRSESKPPPPLPNPKHKNNKKTSRPRRSGARGSSRRRSTTWCCSTRRRTTSSSPRCPSTR